MTDTDFGASGIGLATWADDVLLDVWFPAPTLGSEPLDVADISSAIDTGTSTTASAKTVKINAPLNPSKPPVKASAEKILAN